MSLVTTGLEILSLMTKAKAADTTKSSLINKVFLKDLANISRDIVSGGRAGKHGARSTGVPGAGADSQKRLRLTVKDFRSHYDLPVHLATPMERLISIIAEYTHKEANEFISRQTVKDVSLLISIGATVVSVAAAVLTGAVVKAVIDFVPDVLKNTFNWVADKLKGSPESVDNLVGKGYNDGTVEPKSKLDTMGMIVTVAKQQGVDPAFALAVAHKESAGTFSPNIKASKGSAEGVFQFIDDSWDEYVAKYGKAYNIKKSDRNSTKAQVTMGVLMLKESKVVAKEFGLSEHQALYAYHVLGPSGARFLFTNLAKNPNSLAADLYIKAGKGKVVKNNPGLFYEHNANGKVLKDKPRTIRQLYDTGFRLDNLGYYQKVACSIEQNSQQAAAATSTSTTASPTNVGATVVRLPKSEAVAITTTGDTATKVTVPKATVASTDRPRNKGNPSTVPVAVASSSTKQESVMATAEGSNPTEQPKEGDQVASAASNSNSGNSASFNGERNERTPIMSNGSNNVSMWRNRHGNLTAG